MKELVRFAKKNKWLTIGAIATFFALLIKRPWIFGLRTVSGGFGPYFQFSSGGIGGVIIGCIFTVVLVILNHQLKWSKDPTKILFIGLLFLMVLAFLL